MPHKPFVRTLRAQWLGQELRRLRDSRGMTLKMVSAHLRRDMSALSRYERGEWPIGKTDVLALLDLYGFHHAAERERMLRLAEEVWVTDRWSENYSDILEPSFIDVPWLESRSERVCSFHAAVVPGIFQIREYAERQGVLTAVQGPRLDVVIAEAALRRRIGSPSLCRTQLLHVADCATLSRVTVRVLPPEQGLNRGLDGTFRLYRMPDPYPAVAPRESLHLIEGLAEEMT